MYRVLFQLNYVMAGAARVGLFVVVFIAMVIGAYSVVGKRLLAPKATTYYALFPDAGGIEPGTPILMAGVQVGQVADVKLVSPTEAKFVLSITPGTTIPKGSTALIPASLIGLGDNPISIIAPPGVTDYLEPYATIQGRKGSPLTDMFPEGKETIAELNKTLIATRKLLEDQKLKASVVDLMAQSTKTIETFGRLAEKADALMASNQGTISQALVSGSKAIADVQKVTAAVAKLVEEGKLQKDATAIMAQLKETSIKADHLVASMDALVNDPELIGPTKQTMASVAEMAKTGEKIAVNTEEITKNGVTISANAITLTEKANEIATKASELTDQLKKVLGKVDSFFEKGTSVGGLQQMESEIDLIRESDPGYWRMDVNFKYPLSDGKLNFGLWDTFEGNKLTVQMEKPVSPGLSYRYGVFASKPSLGVDFSLAPRLSLRGDLWDINEPRLDLRARYDLGNGLIGWLGVDRVFNKTAPTIGIGVRR